MILYHITRNLNHNGFFYPDIPRRILENENQTIPRVCTSTSIEGCLGSIPDGGEHLECSISEEGDIFKVFKIDTEKLGLEYILDSSELVENRYVMDASFSDEHWILQDFLVPEEDAFLIEIEGYNVEIQGYENALFYQELEESGMEVDDFYNSELYDPQLHTEDYAVIYNLTYRMINGDDLSTVIEEEKEELLIA